MLKEYVDVMQGVGKKVATAYGTSKVTRLVGFFVVWHLMGGQEALTEKGWDRVTVWRARKEFARVFGAEVDEIWPAFAQAVRDQR